jgi:uncharacterized protein (DUF697 family)
MVKTLIQAEEEARKIVNDRVAWAAGTGWIPGSTIVLAGMDVEMAQQISNTFGLPDSFVEPALAAVAASTIGKGASELLHFIPFIGIVIKAGVAGTVTKATGEGLISYFKNQSPYK